MKLWIGLPVVIQSNELENDKSLEKFSIAIAARNFPLSRAPNTGGASFPNSETDWNGWLRQDRLLTLRLLNGAGQLNALNARYPPPRARAAAPKSTRGRLINGKCLQLRIRPCLRSRVHRQFERSASHFAKTGGKPAG